MAESQEAASFRLYEILERVGLSEEMRLCHRQVVIREMIQIVEVNLITGGNEEYYNFGSFSEGSTVRDMQSDIDIVHCHMNPPVVTDVKEAGVHVSLLMVQDDHTYPGYVKLQGVQYGIPMTISEFDEDEMFGPDIYGRMCFKHHRGRGGTVHGPATEMILEGANQKSDHVFALRCISVPDRLNQWSLRRRQFGWPSRRCLDRMSDFPHFVVGIGHPYSKDPGPKWRLSYSLHERELMFSLNPTQHKCYGTMKMIKKDVIEPKIGEEFISSYHLKTCLFWAIEKTPADIWRPDQLLHCLNRCFWYLLYFVLTQNCPNYFCPDANLFEREEFMRLHDDLSAEIQHIIQTLPDVVSRIRCAGVGRLFLHRTWNIRRETYEREPSAQRLLCILYVTGTTLMFRNGLCHISYRQNTQEERVAIVYHILHKLSRVQRISEHTEEQTEEARQLMLPCLHFHLATCLAGEGFNVNNGPMRQYLLQLSILHLTQSSTRDLMGARLMYVTILYKLGRYHQCETLLRQIDRDIQPHVISACCCYTTKPMTNVALIDWVAANKPLARSMLISAIVTCVTFLPSERELVPEPLQYELNRSRANPHIPSTDDLGHNIYDWACVDGKVYFHLMEYLVFSQLNIPVQKQAARDNIRRVIDNDPELSHRDTNYNVLGWIYGQEGNYGEACRCWNKSLKIQRFHNAASRHVQALRKRLSEGTGS